MISFHDQTRLSSFLLNLECLNMDGQKDAFMNEVIENGGIWYPPRDNDACVTYRFELILHGVYAFGVTEEHAIKLWKRAARAVLAWHIEDDGFITVHPPFPLPRNHGEEIANARATLGSM